MTTSKVVLITGANTGIGYETVKALSSSPQTYTILLGGRSTDKANKAAEDIRKEVPNSASTIQTVQIDIEDDDSINALYNEVESKYGKLDILVNNAGASFDSQLTEGKMTMREVWTRAWTLNVASTQIMTHTFMPLLFKSSDPRLIFLASGTSSFEVAENPDLPINKVPEKGWPKSPASLQGNVPAYRSSKTGMNMMMKEWHRTLREDGVKVWCISPGFLATGLGNNQAALKALGAGHPSLGGEFIKDVIEGQRDHHTGKVILRERVQPW